MGRINLLDPNMVNMIAAGEVIERPASVVKELLENSIDAGATRIQVTLEEGGRRLIAVEDNGSGMDEEDLSRAFDAHATSKIRESGDLQRITTLGFRGEALASLSAVALVKTVSRLAEAAQAHCLEIDCGERSPVTPCSGDYGTSVVVRDLFYKLPARRKFLRTANTEMGHITEQFTRIALAHLDLAFTLTHRRRELYRLAAGESLDARIMKLFPSLLEGEEDAFISTHSQEKEIEVVALLGKPSLSRTTGRYQYIFLNGRAIKDKVITHAIKEAYWGLLEPQRHPVVFLFVSMPFDDYDVNVHPTKTEVRFFKSNLIHSQIVGCLREKLLGADLHVQARLPVTGPRFEANAGTSRGPRSREVAGAMASFFRDHKPPAMSDAYPQPKSQSGVRAPQAAYSVGSVEEEATEPLVDRMTPLPGNCLQIHNSYIVTETEEGLEIIDQHALHEKLLFETLVQRVEQGDLESQKLLVPPTLELNESQVAVLEEHRSLIRQLGITIEAFGPRTYAVHSFPTLLAKVDVVQFILDLIESLEQSGTGKVHDVLSELLDMAACKAAIKAGQALSQGEMVQLLDDADRADSAFRCPHGRPTTLRFSMEELAKQFLRT
ncbi:MAG: DNA mismatch repair endonuclease MutL [Planctomycetes bacterium]|nr:DNA mismatch repair endonuclease MutL [Planctomycetota bacterium]